MEAAEETTPVKPTKTVVMVSQETPPTQPSSHPDWSGPMKAYYDGLTPLQFFTSPVASSNGHAYVWAGQHPMMSAYGNPVPFPAMYPHGGVYVHPSLSMVTTPVTCAPSQPEEKPPNDVADTKTSKKKRYKASSKVRTNGKTASGSGTEIASQSGTSVSDVSLDVGNDRNNHNQELIHDKKGKCNQILEDVANQQKNINAAVGGGNSESSCVPENHHSVLSTVPATNLNIGMSLWNENSIGAATAAATAPVMPLKAENGVSQWTQDEQELKKQKRKQSNRESARRSRQRKQVECEELQKKVDLLYDENRNLAHDLGKLMEQCKQLSSENNSIKEELTTTYGSEAVSDLEGDNLIGDQSRGVEVKVVVEEEVTAART